MFMFLCINMFEMKLYHQNVKVGIHNLKHNEQCSFWTIFCLRIEGFKKGYFIVQCVSVLRCKSVWNEKVTFSVQNFDEFSLHLFSRRINMRVGWPAAEWPPRARRWPTPATTRRWSPFRPSSRCNIRRGSPSSTRSLSTFKSKTTSQQDFSGNQNQK